MLRSLIKKQFTEIFKSYFVNQKTGKARSKGAVIGFSVLFGFLMVMMCFIFFAIAVLLVDILKIPHFEWLYFALMSIVAVLFGLLGSVFNTYASIYLAKDNEMLLSMPIPMKSLVVSRLVGVVGLSLIYSGAVTIPTTIVYLIFGKFDLLSLIFQIVLIPVIAIFISVLACLLGFVVAIIASKLKNKSFITVIISIASIGVYYFFCFRMNDILKSLVGNSENVGKGVKAWGNLFYQIGKASTGDVVSMIIFVAITLISSVLCFVLLVKTYIRIATMNKGEKKTVYKKTTERQLSVSNALLKKEFGRFISSATYMLNCGLGAVILLVVGIIAVIKRNDLLILLEQLKVEIPEYYGLLPIAVAVGIFMAASAANISCPSVSLEGKNLWIYKSLPVDTYMILRAKINLHIYIMAIPVIISTVLLGYALNLDYSTIILISATGYIFVAFSGTLGLILGLLKPNLNWVTETTPIKQSLPAFINMVIGFVIPLVIMAVGYFTRNLIEPNSFIIIVLVIFSLATRYLGNFVKTKGTVIFDNL